MPDAVTVDAPGAKGFRRALFWCGVAAMICLASAAVLSWLLAPFASYETRTYGQFEFFARIGEAFPWLQGRKDDGLPAWRWGLQLAFRSRGLMEDRRLFLATYGLPLMAASLAALGAVGSAWRHRLALQPSDADRALRWGVVFALLLIPAVPVLVPDFWLSVAWGRTLAAGINPYYEVPAAATSWLPLDSPLMHMTYGPLWAYVSAAIMWVTGGHALWGALLFKLVLAAAWIGLLCVVRGLVRDRAPFEQVLAVIMVAWLPIGVVQTVGDGHNDVAMVGCALLWMYFRRTGRPMAATAALTASVLFKYASAPLFLLDALYREPEESRDVSRFVRAYLPRAALAAVLTVAAFAPIFRGLDFFATTSEVHGGHFYLPSDAVLAVVELTGAPLRFLAYVAVGIFPLLTVLELYRYLRDGGGRLREAGAAVMMSMLLLGASHAWPWYVIWFVALAALVPTSAYGRWAMGLALAMPFPLLAWTVAPYADELKRFYLPSLLAYGLALGWFLVIRWRPARTS
ncbi:MAG: hypothetical protein U0132_20130 [Gemmatimonadaceae bacterium]